MNAQEWALIAFTILSQMSVGAFLVLGAVRFYAERKAGPEQADRMTDRVLIAIGVVLGLGFAASLFHLGNPLSAWKAINNFDSSWLSREILSGVVFAVAGAIFVGMQWLKKGPFAARNLVAWIAAGVGIFLVYSQARIYMLPAQPAWNLVTTPLAFFVTTLLLGVFAIGSALVANFAYNKRKNPDCAEVQCTLLRDTIRYIALAAVVLVGIEFVLIPTHLVYLSAGTAPQIASASMLANPLLFTFILRLVLVFAGAGVVAVFLYRLSTLPGRENLVGSLAYSAFALVLVSEVIGRYLFFVTRQGTGL